MNRKRKAKIEQAIVKATNSLHPLNDPLCWLTDTPPCPWTDEQIAEYQAKLDSAFGAERAIVLAWSGDKRYWDSFYVDWHFNGEPKGSPEKKPALLWKEIAVNEHDYVYISVPRFILYERLHGSEMEASWKESSWVADPEVLGGMKRIRTEKAPEAFYHILETIAEHEVPSVSGHKAPCCERMEPHSICYGKYAPPSDKQLMKARDVRIKMDKDGVAQRNDAPRSEKLMARAAASTQYFYQRAAEQRRSAVQELIMSDPQQFMGDVFKNYGVTMTAPEIDKVLKEGFSRQQEKI